MTSCLAALKKQCVFAKTREACLGIDTRRKAMDAYIQREFGTSSANKPEAETDQARGRNE